MPTLVSIRKIIRRGGEKKEEGCCGENGTRRGSDGRALRTVKALLFLALALALTYSSVISACRPEDVMK